MTGVPGGTSEQATAGARMALERSADALVVALRGTWQLDGPLPGVTAVEAAVDQEPTSGVRYDAAQLQGWDSSVLTFLQAVEDACERRGVPVDRGGLPASIRRLVELARTVPERTEARPSAARDSVLARVGRRALESWDGAVSGVRFLGSSTLAVGRFLAGRASYRRSELGLLIQQAGVDALGIVSLVSFLFGLILAFVGAVQLQRFGASIYVADLVAVGMVRDMAAFMTAIIVAGRSGAAYAAQLGTMKVTEEIDALRTTGISPIEFLVAPRVVALVLMMPLLTVYADLVGILGGFVVGTGLLEITPRAYVQQTTAALGMELFIPGVVKGTIYGLLVAVAGCREGMRAGSSASAVGDAATRAVVSGVVAIIVACGIAQVISWVFRI